MKKGILWVAVAVFLIAGTASAQGMMGRYNTSGTVSTPSPEDPAITAALQDIYAAQSVSKVSDVNCSKLSDAELEKLGDVYMGLIHPGSSHDAVEQMMGGEGSPVLKQAHINMGRSYLGCWSGYNGAPTWGMMGAYAGNGGVPVRGGYGGMMSGYYGSGLGGGAYWTSMVTTILFWIVLLLVIVAMVKHITKKH